MLRASMTFFVLGIFALILGSYQLADVSFGTGRLLFMICLGLAMISFAARLFQKPHAD